MTYPSINKVLFISDIHFGVRQNSIEWLEIQKDYFNEFFIPLLQEYDPERTALIVAGDVFDNRQSIHILVMNTAQDIFGRIGSILPTHIIVGNHDLYRKSITDINSLKSFNYMPGVHVYEQPKVLTFGEKSFLMMPWRTGPEDEALCISQYDTDYLVCHTDVKGLRFNKKVSIEHGNDVEIMGKFLNVFSGHIHYGQTLKNLIMLGCPYHLTRSDIGNPKGVWELDLEDGSTRFIRNDHSPKFIRANLDALLELTESQISDIMRNNFVDLIVRPELLTEHNFPMNVFVERFTNARKISIQMIDRELSDEEADLTEDALSNFDLLKFAKTYIDSLGHADKIKDLIYKKIDSLYSIASGLTDEIEGES